MAAALGSWWSLSNRAAPAVLAQAFGSILNLVPLAESVVKLNAVCMECYREASYTKRLGAEREVSSPAAEHALAAPSCQSCCSGGVPAGSGALQPHPPDFLARSKWSEEQTSTTQSAEPATSASGPSSLARKTRRMCPWRWSSWTRLPPGRSSLLDCGAPAWGRVRGRELNASSPRRRIWLPLLLAILLSVSALLAKPGCHSSALRAGEKRRIGWACCRGELKREPD